MKAFIRSFCGCTLAFLMLLYCGWRYDLMPDMSTINGALQGAMGQIDELTGLIEGQIPNPPAEGDEPAPQIPFEQIEPVGSLNADLEATLYAAVTAHEKVVNVSSFKMLGDDFQRAMTQFFFNNPELFYVSTAYYVNKPSENAHVAQVQLIYLYEKEEIPAMVEVYEQRLAEIVAGVPADGTDFDKILYLHDYFVQNFAYDYEGLAAERATGENQAIRDTYRFFTERIGVCQAYMLGLIAAAERVGIPCLPVTSDGMGHAWNLVKLDGEWYHIDITWDDAGGEAAPVYPTYVSYRHFLLSDAEMYRSDPERQKGWETTELADSTRYDEAQWRGACTPLLKRGGDYYCMLYYRTNPAQSGFVAIMRGSDVSMTVEKDLQGVLWTPPGTTSNYYPYAWSTLAEFEGRLIFNGDGAIYTYSERAGLLGVWMVVDLSDELDGMQVFGILDIASDGTLSYVAAMDHSGEFVVRTVDITP